MEARVTDQLTSKQAAFVEEFLKDHSPAGAALRAGYSAKSGKRLLADPAVAAEVAKREAEFEHDVTVSTRTLLADADRAQALAEKASNASAMVAAIQLKARLSGLDKPDIPQDPDGVIAKAVEAARTEIATIEAHHLLAKAAISLGLPEGASPAQIIGAVTERPIVPPDVYVLLRGGE